MSKNEKDVYTKVATKIIAYFDLLGFSHYCKEDRNGAEELLQCFSRELSDKKKNDKLNDENEYLDERVKQTTEENGVSTFEYFLPFSDGVLIIAPINKTDLFVKQISHFVCDTFGEKIRTFATVGNGENPTQPRIRSFDKKGYFTGNVKEHWYPFMWRGGVTVGDVKIFNGRNNFIIDNELKDAVIALGKGVVEAVRLEEKSGRGPRIFCSEKFVKLLQQDVYLEFIYESEEEDKYDLLWPKAIEKEWKNDFSKAVENLKEYIETDATAGSDVKEQYQIFKKLLERSGIEYREQNSFVSNNL